MNYEEHHELLKECIEAKSPDEWNETFRPRHLSPILKGITIRDVKLEGFKFSGTVFQNAKIINVTFKSCKFSHSDFDIANIQNCKFIDSPIQNSTFRSATIEKVDFETSSNKSIPRIQKCLFQLATIRETSFKNALCSGSNFSCKRMEHVSFQSATMKDCIFAGVSMSYVDFTDADISGAIFKICDIRSSKFVSCIIVGTLFWDCTRLISKYDNVQENLILKESPIISLNRIETAQFMSMIEQERVDEIITEVTSKAVLILGRFSDPHKTILDALRIRLKELNWVPVIFDFEMTDTRDVTETITLLARLSKFIIADLTDAKSAQQEVAAIAPHIAVPIVPIIKGEEDVFSMFRDYWKYEWVLEEFRYDDLDHLLSNLQDQIISIAESKANELNLRKQKAWSLKDN